MNTLFENLSISKRQLKVFVGAFLAMFIMICLQHMGIRSPINPLAFLTNHPQPTIQKIEVPKTVQSNLGSI